MKTDDRLVHLPGGVLVQQGLADLQHGRRTIPAKTKQTIPAKTAIFHGKNPKPIEIIKSAPMVDKIMAAVLLCESVITILLFEKPDAY